jgi:NitT/TauT family transport system ATP-binding protein
MKLQIQNINKYFRLNGDKISALSEISLSVSPGEFICLVGPSGCGKTTLLNLIAGLDIPSSGEIDIEGKLGFMFQEPTLFPWLNVENNIAFGLKILRRKNNEINDKVSYFLDLVHLNQFRKAYPHELSGGMKQRVALARNLILDPDILLMDEPFTALDAQTRELLYEELQLIWQKTKKTIIFVTHNVREAVVLGDRVIILTARPGKIKNIIDVKLPRPRDIGNLSVIKTSNLINIQLKEEVNKIKQSI